MSTKKVLAGIAPALLAALLLSRAEAAAHRNEKVYQAAEANRAGALELLKEIVNIDSGTGDVAGGTKVEAVLADRLKALGAEVRTETAEVARPARQCGGGVSWHGQGQDPDHRPYRHRVRSRHSRGAAVQHGRSSARTAPAWVTKRRAWSTPLPR